MNMKLGKKSKSVIAIYAILLVVYIVAFLIIPFNKIAASWISFAFTIIAIAGSLLIFNFAFNAKETLVSKIYGYPIFRVGAVYALAQLVIGVVICAISAVIAVPYWVALLVSVILLGAAAIGVIITDNTRALVEEVDESVNVDTKNVTRFQIDIAGIDDVCENTEVKADLEKLNELFRFSDPVTNDETREVEESIKTMLAELKTIVADGSTDDINALIKRITNTLNERNRICKASKG